MEFRICSMTWERKGMRRKPRRGRSSRLWVPNQTIQHLVLLVLRFLEDLGQLPSAEMEDTRLQDQDLVEANSKTATWLTISPAMLQTNIRWTIHGPRKCKGCLRELKRWSITSTSLELQAIKEKIRGLHSNNSLSQGCMTMRRPKNIRAERLGPSVSI